MTLYEIDRAILGFDYQIDEETGEILNAEALDELQMARDAKIENVGLYIKKLEAEAEAIKKECDSLRDRQKRKERRAESLRNYLAYALRGERFETPRILLSWRRSESVSIPDEALLDDRFVNITLVKRPDKKLIKDTLKAGREVPGAELVKKNNLQIK